MIGAFPLQVRQTTGAAPLGYMASLNPSVLPSGAYTLKVVLKQGGKSAVSDASFEIAGPAPAR